MCLKKVFENKGTSVYLLTVVEIKDDGKVVHLGSHTIESFVSEVHRNTKLERTSMHQEVADQAVTGPTTLVITAVLDSSITTRKL